MNDKAYIHNLQQQLIGAVPHYKLSRYLACSWKYQPQSRHRCRGEVHRDQYFQDQNQNCMKNTIINT